MFITIALSGGTLAIGGAIVLANAAMTWYSGVHARKRQQVQHEYEEKALREGHQAAMQQFQELCNLKKEIAEDEFKRNVEFLKRQQRQSLRDVGYFASLDEWPLRIPPMVMRNDNLFLNSNTEDLLPHEVENMFSNIVMQVEPVHIIMSPCRDKNFRENFHAEMEKRLSSFLEKYWGPSSLHPVVFYKQCWKDKTNDADEITVNNMFSKLCGIPTIIINPVMGEDSLRFETSFQNIFVDNRDENKEGVVISAPILFPQDVYPFKKGMEYSGDDKERLSDEIALFLMSMLSMLIDQYYWRRYHFAPHQPDIIKQHAINYSTHEINSLYTDYFQNFTDTLSSSDIHPLIETDETLNYCKAVDVLSDKSLCFKEVLRKLSNCEVDNLNKLLSSIPFLNASFFKSLILFCKGNQTLYSISNETIDNLQYKLDFNNYREILYRKAKQKISENPNRMPYDHYSCEETNAYKRISKLIEIRRDAFWNNCRNFTYKTIRKSRQTSKYTDKRDWARKRIESGIKEMADNEINSIIPSLYNEIKEIEREAIQLFVNETIHDCQHKTVFIKKILLEVSQILYKELVEKYVKDISWTPKDIWLRKDRPAYYFADKVVNVWIKYVFLDEDIVYKSTQISNVSKKEIKDIFMEHVWEWYVVTETNNELEKIFDGEKIQSPLYDDYSSDNHSIEWSFGDPITETFGIY